MKAREHLLHLQIRRPRILDTVRLLPRCLSPTDATDVAMAILIMVKAEPTDVAMAILIMVKAESHRVESKVRQLKGV